MKHREHNPLEGSVESFCSSTPWRGRCPGTGVTSVQGKAPAAGGSVPTAWTSTTEWS